MKKLVFALVFLSYLSGCNYTNNIFLKQKPVSKTEVGLLDTVNKITLYEYEDKKVLDEAFNLIEFYHNLLVDEDIPESEIYLINNSKGKTITVSNEVIELLEASIYYSEISEGKFDITIGAVSKYWDFTAENPSVPDKDLLEEGAKHVNYKNIYIEGNTVTLLDENSRLDLGAIAKGYIADKVKIFLQENGVKSAIIDLGGDVVVFGGKTTDNGKAPFVVGVRDPNYTVDEILGTIKTTENAIVTTGIYERSFNYDGNFYHHILDPTTGMSFNSDIAGVSIVSELSIEGEGLSTIAFLLNVDKGIEFIESIENVEAIFIKKDNSIYFTSGIGEKVDFTKINENI